jgi:hypothetical protein
VFLKLAEWEKQSLEIERPTRSQVREVMRLRAGGLKEKIKRRFYSDGDKVRAEEDEKSGTEG